MFVPILKNSVSSSLPLCGGVCLQASLALTGTWSKLTPAAFWPRGTCLINHALVPMKRLVSPPAVDQSAAPRGPRWSLAYHPWSGPNHVSQTKMDSACHARAYHAWVLPHELNMRSGGVLLKKEKDPEDVSLHRFTHAVFLSFFFIYFFLWLGRRQGKKDGMGRRYKQVQRWIRKQCPLWLSQECVCEHLCVGNPQWPEKVFQRSFWSLFWPVLMGHTYVLILICIK